MTYLKGLNGIRALAALIVLCGHIAIVTRLTDNKSINIASYGVTVFFALSGFLITYLLLKEREKTNIDILRFYLRRMLRIWPLYFFYLGVALFFTPAQILPNCFYYLFFAPNFAMVFDRAISLLDHYWSLGVEEQFYLGWPWLIKKSKNVFYALIVFTVAFLLIKVLINLYVGGWSQSYSLIYQTRFDCMAIGGIGAVMYFESHKTINFLTLRIVQLACWIVLILFMTNSVHTFSIVDHEIVAILTAAIIIGQIIPDKPLINLENYLLKYIGKISFGIYIYHPLVIDFFSHFILNKMENSFMKNLIGYAGIITTTILVSSLSYFYFENFFLNLKDKNYSPRNLERVNNETNSLNQ